MTTLPHLRRGRSIGAAIRRASAALAVVASGAVATTAPRAAAAQWARVTEQFYLPADHNWTFRRLHPQADRLFNAFDYGHAILYETLWARPGAPVDRLERREYDYLTRTLLRNPPRVPLAEEAIEPLYARMAPEAKAMFEWAHLLHRQVYDVLADDRLSEAGRDAEVARLMRYYRSRPDLAFSARPKSMALMQEQWYSLAFRQRYPKFNGLIWAYHWLQVGLYEPLVVGETPEARQAGVTAAVARFQQMLADAPRTMPYQMPMTAEVAPRFAARYPDVAIVFDNLHSMHDVISDVLANPAVPRGRKRAEILLAGRRYRDDTTQVMTVPAWRAMGAMMGVQNMGGRAVGFLPTLPTPTVERGAVMRHAEADHEAMGHGAEHPAPATSPAVPAPRPGPPAPVRQAPVPAAPPSGHGTHHPPEAGSGAHPPAAGTEPRAH